ncbi:MAG: hypothetical protein AB1689_01190 [Thermodesulfobacteriota bacterium]
MLRWGATEVHPLVVRAVMVKEPCITDYQVQQTPRGVDVAVLASAPLDADHLRAALGTALADAGLRDADVVVRSVPALARHPETGKVRRFIPV